MSGTRVGRERSPAGTRTEGKVHPAGNFPLALRNAKVGDSSRADDVEGEGKRAATQYKIDPRCHVRRRSIIAVVLVVVLRRRRQPMSAMVQSTPSTGWKQRITRRENRLTRLAIDPTTGKLISRPLLTRRANKGEIPRPFRGIKYLGAIYLLRSLSLSLSFPSVSFLLSPYPSLPFFTSFSFACPLPSRSFLLPLSLFLLPLLSRRRPRWDFIVVKRSSHDTRRRIRSA